MPQIFLGRFVLLQDGTITGEGYPIGVNTKLKTFSEVRIYDHDVDRRLGSANVIKIGNKICVDLYGEENETLHNLLKKGRKLLIPRGRVGNLDDYRKLTSYELSYVCIANKEGTSQEIENISVLIDYEKEMNWFKTGKFKVN